MRTATLRCNNGCFVVLSADFLTVPAKQIEGMRALATYPGGKQVYAAAGWDSN
jgi:predicted amidohydrolase YtcJ